MTALRISSGAPDARVLRRITSAQYPASARSRTLRLAPGVYWFQVVARNAVGASAVQRRSVQNPL